jgi:hypothetical protein
MYNVKTLKIYLNKKYVIKQFAIFLMIDLGDILRAIIMSESVSVKMKHN